MRGTHRLDEQQVKERTAITIKMANAANESAETVSDQLTAVWNNFDDGSQSLEHYADVMLKLGAATASSSDEIAQGVEKFAAIGKTIGLSYDYAATALATVTATTRQSADVVGTAFKTLFSRIQGLNLGETLEDGTTLNKYSKALASVGVNIKDQNGALRDADDILDDMGDKWTEISKDQQVALAQVLGGARQYNQIMALMDNWDYFKQNLVLAKNSEGTLEQQAKVFEESWEAASKRVKAAAQGVYDSLIDDNFFISFDNGLATVLGGVEKLVDGFGGLKGILITTSAIFSKLYADKMADGLRNIAYNAAVNTGILQRQEIASKQQILKYVSGMMKDTDSFNESEQISLRTTEKILGIQIERANYTRDLTEEEKAVVDAQINQLKNLEAIALKLQEVKSIQSQIVVNSINSAGDLDDESVLDDVEGHAEEVAERKARLEAIHKIENSSAVMKLSGSDEWVDKKINGDDVGAKGWLSATAALSKYVGEAGLAEEQLSQLKTSLYDIKSGAKTTPEEAVKSLKSLIPVIEQVTGKVIDADDISKEALTKILAQIRSMITAANKIKEEYKNQYYGRSGEHKTDKDFEAMMDAAAGAGRAQGQLLMNTEDSKGVSEDATAFFDALSKKTDDWAAKVTKVGQAVMGLTATLSAFKNLADVWTDEDTSIGDKMLSTMSAFPAVMMDATTALNAFKDSQKEGIVHTTIQMLLDKKLIKENAEVAGSYTAAAGAGEIFNAVVKHVNVTIAASPLLPFVLGIAGIVAILAIANVAVNKFGLTAEAAAKRISNAKTELSDAEDNLSSVKTKLDEVNKSIENLLSKDKLSFTENAELQKLEQQKAILEQQADAQERYVKAKKQAYLLEIKQGFKMTASGIDDAPKKTRYLGNTDVSHVPLIGFTAEEYKAKYGETEAYEKLLEKDEQKRQQWMADNLEALQELESQYLEYYQGIIDGDITDTDEGIKEKQKILKQKRMAQFGNDEEQYNAAYIAPVMDKSSVSSDVFEVAEHGGDISKDTQQAIEAAGLSIDEVIDYANAKLEALPEKMAEKYGESAEQFDKIRDQLSGEELSILVNLDESQLPNDINDLQEYLNDKKVIINLQAMIDEDSQTVAQIEDAISALTSKNYNELSDSQKAFLSSLEEDYGVLSSILDKNSQLYKDALWTIQKDLQDNIVENMQAKFQQSLSALRKTITQTDKDGNIVLNFSEKGLKEIGQDLDDILNQSYQIDIQINSNIEKEKKHIEDLSDVMQDAAGKISSSYQVSAKDIEAVSAVFPEILENATVTANGMIQLDGNVAESAKATAQTELQSQVDSLKAQMEAQATMLHAKGEAYMAIAEAAEACAKTEMVGDEVSTEQRAAIQEAYTKALALEEQSRVDKSADAAQGMADASADAATSMDKSQKEATISYQTHANERVRASGQETAAIIQNANKVGTAIDNASKGKKSSLTNVRYSAVNVGSGYYKHTSNKVGKTDIDQDSGGGLGSLLSEALTGGFSDGGQDYVALAKNAREIARAYFEAERKIRSGMLSTEALSKLPFTFGSGSGGSGGDEASVEELKLIIERYHEITREIEYLNTLIDRYDKESERAFGTKRLELYANKLKTLQDLAVKQRSKALMAKASMVIDLASLEEVGFKNVKTDAETGEITNYTQLITEKTNEYNAYMTKWNAMSADQQKTHEKEKEQIEKTYEKQMDALDQYEESLDTYREMLDAYEDSVRDIQDQKLNIITAKIEMYVKVEDIKKAATEYSKTINDAIGDALTNQKALNALGLDKKAAESNLNLMKQYQQSWDELQYKMNNNSIYDNKEDLINALSDLQDKIVETGGDLIDYVTSLKEVLPNALSDARARFEEFTNQLDHNNTVAEAIEQLLNLQGYTYKSAQGFKSLQNSVSSQMQTSLEAAKANRIWAENARKELVAAEQALAMAQEGTVTYDILKANRDALLSEFNQAQEALLSSAQSAMEKAKTIYTNALEKIAYEFDQALTNGIGSDLFSTTYDRLIKEEERYLDKVNERYEISKWYRTLQKEIDETTNSVYANQLKALQEEINARAENNTLAQYDLDILEAKYKMTQAQMALEEAKNNQTSVRLVRNSSGNWDYQFTADQGAIDNATQDYEDAVNNYYNIAKSRVKDILDQIKTSKTETAAKLKEIYADETLTEQERNDKIAELRKDYYNTLTYLQEEYNVALKDMTDAGGDIIKSEGNTYQEVMDLMGKGTEDFMSSFDAACKDMQDAFKEYNSTIKDISKDTGLDLGGLNSVITNVNSNTQTMGKEVANAATSIWSTIGKIQDATSSYTSLAESIWNVVKASQAMTNASGGSVDGLTNRKGYDPDIDYASLYYYAKQNGASADDLAIIAAQRQQKINDNKDMNEEWKGDITAVDPKQVVPGYATSWQQILDKIKKFGTGGYTGDDSGLALLHNKELVLNQEDTQNILNAVGVVRNLGADFFKSIERKLDNNIGYGNLMMSKLITGVRSADIPKAENITYQNNVFDVDFPGVTAAVEIQEALEGLLNEAAQYVGMN